MRSCNYANHDSQHLLFIKPEIQDKVTYFLIPWSLKNLAFFKGKMISKGILYRFAIILLFSARFESVQVQKNVQKII